MGVRLYTELTSMQGIDYRVRVYDDSYASTAIEVTCSNVELEYEPSDESLVSPIIASMLKFTIYDDGTTGVDTAIVSLETSDEKSIKVTLERDTGSGYELEWVGLLQKDLIWRENAPEPTSITLTATDGLNLLKDIRYPGIANGTHTGSSQLAQFIVECLDELGLSGFWGASDPYLRDSIEWDSNEISAPSTGDSVLLYTRCDVLKFRDDPKSLETTNKTCYECLEGIMNLFGAQLMHSNGCYYIRQPRNYDSTSHSESRISKGLSELSTASVSNDVTTVSNTTIPSTDQVRVLGGGQFAHREPLDIVRAVVKPGYLLNSDTIDVVKIGKSIGSVVHTETIPLGTVIGYSSPDTFLQINAPIIARTEKYGLKVTITVNLGTSWYLKYEPSTGQRTWESTLQSGYEYEFPAPGDDSIDVTINTPYIPVGSFPNSNVVVKTEFYDFANDTQAILANLDADARARIEAPEIVLQGEDEDYITNFEIDIYNTISSDNSEVLDMGDMWFNDNAIISTKNLFEVNESGSTWVVTDTWDAGYDTDVSLWLTALYERMSYQQDPVKMYRGSIEGFYRPHLQWIYNSESFVMRRLRCLLHSDEHEGDWWEINQAVNSITLGNKRDLADPDGIRRTRNPRRWSQDDGTQGFVLTRLGQLGSNIDESDTVTSIDLIEQLGNTFVKNGDPIIVVSPYTGKIVQEFACDTDSASSDTSISVTSESADHDMRVGWAVMFKNYSVSAADILRGGTHEMNVQVADSDAGSRAIYESSDSGQLSYKDSSDNIMPLGEMKSVVNLSSGDIGSLDTTPIEIVATPGSGYYIEPIRIILNYNYISTAYTGLSGTVEVKYATSATRVAFNSNNPFKEGGDKDVQLVLEPSYHNSGLTDLSNLDNNALEISITQNRATGDGTCNLVVYYKVIAI